MGQVSVLARFTVLSLAVAWIAGCGSRSSAPEPAAPPPAPVPVVPAPESASSPIPAPVEPATAPPPAAVVPSAPLPAPSTANRVDDYKRDFANRVYQTSPAQVFRGRPPPLLRSVIVASVMLDASGNVVDARILRDNGDAETVAATLASIRRGAPYPRPAPSLVRGGRLQVVETWLFRNDGQFQVRSIAEQQRSE